MRLGHSQGMGMVWNAIGTDTVGEAGPGVSE